MGPTPTQTPSTAGLRAHHVRLTDSLPTKDSADSCNPTNYWSRERGPGCKVWRGLTRIFTKNNVDVMKSDEAFVGGECMGSLRLLCYPQTLSSACK